MAKSLIPEDLKRLAIYTLAQHYGPKVNFVSWIWHAETQRWRSIGSSPMLFTPEELASAGWKIFEECSEDVYIVVDVFGQTRSRDDVPVNG